MTMTRPDTPTLQAAAQQLRGTMFRTICRGGGGHLPASLSIAEILTVLYDVVLRVDPQRPNDPGRDRFILSKGHACVALYAKLAQTGFFPSDWLDTFGHDGTDLGGHPDMHKLPGIEASTGSLGHGLGFGAGIALGAKLDAADYRVYVLLGDGECQEGSVWEAALFAGQHRLDNLVAIVDYNKLQALDRLDNIVSLEPLAEKFCAFGWHAVDVDGHNVDALLEAFELANTSPGRPIVIIAHTTKGKGISFMEKVPIWHYRMPNPDERRIACEELGIDDPLEAPA